jgi:hypothetical protein
MPIAGSPFRIEVLTKEAKEQKDAQAVAQLKDRAASNEV